MSVTRDFRELLPCCSCCCFHSSCFACCWHRCRCLCHCSCLHNCCFLHLCCCLHSWCCTGPSSSWCCFPSCCCCWRSWCCGVPAVAGVPADPSVLILAGVFYILCCKMRHIRLSNCYYFWLSDYWNIAYRKRLEKLLGYCISDQVLNLSDYWISDKKKHWLPSSDYPICDIILLKNLIF